MSITSHTKLVVISSFVLMFLSASVLAGQQSDAPWGLDRIDQRDLPLDTIYQFDTQGSGVHVYIIGTGVDAKHPEFGKRVAAGCKIESGVCKNDKKPTDGNGNGTHAAGIVGAKTYGVAKNVTIHPVAVLSSSGSGSFTDAIAGMNWVISQHAANHGPSVALFALAGGMSQEANDAATAMVDAGITVVAPAGNSNANACNFSPGSAPTVVTVGATEIDGTGFDRRATFSNFSTCVDIFAPAVEIESTWLTNTTNVLNSTIAAAAHVAGVAALYLGEYPHASPASVASFLTSEASLNYISNVGAGSPNRLLYSRVIPAADFAEELALQALEIIAVLPAGSFTNNGHRTALTNHLLNAVKEFGKGHVKPGLKKVEEAIARTDGCALRGSPDSGGGPKSPAQDYINNCADQDQNYPLLLEALQGPY